MMTITSRKMSLENKHLFVWVTEGKSLEKWSHERFISHLISIQIYECPVMLP